MKEYVKVEELLEEVDKMARRMANDNSNNRSYYTYPGRDSFYGVSRTGREDFGGV